MTSHYLYFLFPGDRYVVVDCGGGTVDLTVHQIRMPEGHLKELYKASGESRLLSKHIKKYDYKIPHKEVELIKDKTLKRDQIKHLYTTKGMVL